MIINRTKISYLTIAAQLIMAFLVKVGKKKISNNKNQIPNHKHQIANKSQTINGKRYSLFTPPEAGQPTG